MRNKKFVVKDVNYFNRFHTLHVDDAKNFNNLKCIEIIAW